MIVFKSLIFITLFYLSYLKAVANERFICTRVSTNEVLNFYISERKLYLSGLSISGTYNILTKYSTGILAINMSEIGNESGLELVFINLNNNNFSIKSKISNNIKSNLIEINGTCKKIKK